VGFILHSVAERNAIEEKFDGDVLKSDYAKTKIDQFLEVYKESQQLEWSGLPSSDIIKDGLEEIFRDIMAELREITRAKKAELKEVLEGYDRIAKGIEGNKGGE
jgi:2-hydroxy-3-keto-5-methylthiopentenyl-1-phosphate phosphatase